MGRQRYLRMAAPFAALAVLLAFSGCGGGSSGSGGGLQLYLADDPLDAQAVNVTVTRVDVAKAGEGWTTLRDFGSNGITIDLLKYRYDGNSLTPDQYLLADSPLTEGHYTQIRLLLQKVELVDAAGQPHECEMSSQDRTGLKLVGSFAVAAGKQTAVLLDFDLARSIVKQGNGTYRLKPTIRVVPLELAGKVHGTVVFQSGAASPVAVPPDAKISAYQGTALVATALINGDGTFGFQGLTPGSYTLRLETPNFAAPDNLVTVTAGGDTDAGTITAIGPQP